MLIFSIIVLKTLKGSINLLGLPFPNLGGEIEGIAVKFIMEGEIQKLKLIKRFQLKGKIKSKMALNFLDSTFIKINKHF